MKRVLLASTVIAAWACGSVFAADMPLKGPVYAPFSWSGCYAGINGGGNWNSTSFTIGNNNPGFFGPAFAAGVIPGSHSLDTSGGIVGGQAGCNYQTGNYVIGIEGDADWVDRKGSQAISTNVTGFFPAVATATETLQSLSTIRGRLGYAFDHLLLHGTGGIAFGNTNDFYSFTSGPGGVTLLNTYSSNRLGGTAGAGVEYAFGYGWSAKLEGLWYRLNSTQFLVGGTAPGLPAGAALVVTPNSDSGWMLKAGLNYKVW
jgi:outer membrane immunogenic protein